MMGKRKVFNCIYCARPVTGRHHAIACDVCGEWQHRKCQTGMLLQVYFRLVSQVITYITNIAVLPQTNL